LAQQQSNTTQTSSAVSLDDMDKYGLLAANPLGKYSDLIKKFQLKEGTILLNNFANTKHSEVNVEKMRNGEVLVVTIPADDLFLPNDTILRESADQVLSHFKRYLKSPDMFWVILDMHTDNTGSEVYTDRLSLQRVNAVFDWFDDQGCDTRFLFPTASGAAEPLPGNNNESLQQRRQNRRLEILLVPGEKMIEEAKKGRIAF
jgi:outer membrane protein OmpA-like peptidoglycan-associated protein